MQKKKKKLFDYMKQQNVQEHYRFHLDANIL